MSSITRVVPGLPPSAMTPFSIDFPCPACGATEGCYYTTRRTFVCKTDSAAGVLRVHPYFKGYLHWRDRPCPCGKDHPAPPGRAEGESTEGATASNGSTPGPDERASGADTGTKRIPIIRAARPWPVLGKAALHGLAGNVVRTIEPSTEADPAGILVSFLLAFGSMVGRRAYVKVGPVSHYPNEYALLVGSTSKSRKGTATAVVRSLMGGVERYWSLNCTGSGLSTGEGLIHAVRDPSMGADKKTGEEITIDLGVLDKRLFLVQEEFASVLAVSGRDKNTLSETVREAWDGREVLRNMNKNSPERATGAHVSLLGHITLDELRRHLTETETANGFANRFLFACVQRSKELAFGGYADLETLAGPVAAALEFTHSLGETGEESAGTVTWAAQTRPLWVEHYGRLSAPKRGLVGALTARAEAHVLRLALIYALLDSSDQIQPAHLEAAMALWSYCVDSATYIFGDSLGDPVASGILTLLGMTGAAGADRSDILRHFGNNLSAGRLEAALLLLLEAGAIAEWEERGGGRPRRVYALAGEQGATPGA